MDLFRIYAYAVTPQRKAEVKQAPSGGAFPVNDDIRKALEALFVSSKLASQAIVNFRFDGNGNGQERQHEVRDHVMNFAFQGPAKAKAAAQTLATRLADSMDERSPPTTLFILAAARSGARSRMTLWAFPQDQAFQFRSGKNRASIRLLDDVFSRSSRLRKAALFEGKNRNADFLSGRILDLQTMGGFGRAADYWISDFLDCRLGLEGESGTRLLAKHLQEAYESLDNQADRDQLYNSIIAVRTSPKRTWSATQFATHYLQGEAKRVFVQSVPTDLRNLSFKFQRDVFENKLNFRVFRLEHDIYVSAPFGTVGNGKPVRIIDGPQRKLQVEAPISSEKVRARHA
jgi:hypothetical protein